MPLVHMNKQGNGVKLSVPALPLALDLDIGTEDQIAALGKLQPILLPNHAPGGYETPDLIETRNSYAYIYVVNWLYHFRGFLKLQSDLFDVDIFELELLGHFPDIKMSTDDSDAPLKSLSLFLTKLKIALMSAAQNSRLKSIENFEKIFRLWFGPDTPLGGVDDADDDDAENKPSNPLASKAAENILFDALKMSEKFEVLYILINHISQYANFKNWMDKNSIPLDQLRMKSIYSEIAEKEPRAQHDYFLLFDNLRLYKRTIKYTPLVIPKKRKLLPADPNLAFAQECFDISMDVKFDLIFQNVYELEKFVETSSIPQLSHVVANQDNVDLVFAAELRKRRYLTNRRKELQLASLLATRKRSSRIEAKEKQRQEELELQGIDEEYEMQLAARSERRRKMRDEASTAHALRKANEMDYTNGRSRDQRLQGRRLHTESAPETQPETTIEMDNAVASVPTDSEVDAYETMPPSATTQLVANGTDSIPTTVSEGLPTDPIISEPTTFPTLNATTTTSTSPIGQAEN